MPCDGSYLNQTEREAESQAVLELLREIDGRPFDHEDPKTDYYGCIETLDADIARLCEWCRTHNVKSRSLELQLWWKRHQKADEAKARESRAQQARRAARKRAKAKLTQEELSALRDVD